MLKYNGDFVVFNEILFFANLDDSYHISLDELPEGKDLQIKLYSDKDTNTIFKSSYEEDGLGEPVGGLTIAINIAKKEIFSFTMKAPIVIAREETQQKISTIKFQCSVNEIHIEGFPSNYHVHVQLLKEIANKP